MINARCSFVLLLISIVVLVLALPLAAQSQPGPGLGSLLPVSQLLPPLLTPVTNNLTGLLSLLTKPRDMKLLVISAEGTDPGFVAIRAILDQIGVPYDTVVLTQTHGALPALETAGKGLYQGIILSTGNLATCSTSPCSIALPAQGWTTLDRYAAQYGVRTLSYYTFPDPRYGITWSGQAQLGGTASYTGGAAGVFRNANRSNTVPVQYAYVYGALAAPGPGDMTTPILTIDGLTAGVLHTKADGREYMALTFDNNPYLVHSLVFGYDLVSWVTKGMFLGNRNGYLSPQIDDIFLGSDLYTTAPGCQPPGFQLDPTVDPSAGCPVARITGGDLNGLTTWQSSLNSRYGSAVKLTMAFNGFGTTAASGAPSSDDLPAAASNSRGQFFWISHTYDHENLDCYQPVLNSHQCTPATYAQSLAEIDNNASVGRQLNLPQDSSAMITPNVSGLGNGNFLSAAASRGIRYVVMDASVLPASVTPNTGIRDPLRSSILEVPRRPTSIFYNTVAPYAGLPGSETDEYNYFYGPNGISRVGGPGGPPFFTSDQTYGQIVDRESQFILLNMLRGEVYPIMFHQANLVRYDGLNSLLTDVVSAAVSKFRSYSTIPLQSLSLTSTGGVIEDRMAFNASGVTATLTPGLTIAISVSKSATIPVTGLCRAGCESTGAQSVSYYSANPLLPTLILLP